MTRSLIFSSFLSDSLPGEGVLPKFFGGGVPHGFQNPNLFQTKIYDFSDPFSDLTPKICTPFQTLNDNAPLEAVWMSK